MQQGTAAEYISCSKSSQQSGSKVDRLSRSCKASALAQPPRPPHGYRVRLAHSPRLPFNGELPHMVRALFRRGERRIVLDLAGISSIDAAGIGELVRAYNFAIASNVALRIVNTSPWVREMLERVGLFDRMSAGRNDMQEPDRMEDRDMLGPSDAP